MKWCVSFVFGTNSRKIKETHYHKFKPVGEYASPMGDRLNIFPCKSVPFNESTLSGGDELHPW